MLEDEKALFLGSQVETAVINTGIPDYDLASGAGIVASQDRYKNWIKGEHPDKEFVRVLGVTILSISYDNDVTFRTATFGVTSEKTNTQLDAMGTASTLQVSTIADKKPTQRSIANSKLMMSTRYQDLYHRGSAIIGGVIMHEGVEENTIASQLFVSNRLFDTFEAVSTNRVAVVAAKIATMLNPNPEIRQKWHDSSQDDRSNTMIYNNYLMLISDAKKREGGPVAVDQSFYARLNSAQYITTPKPNRD